MYICDLSSRQYLPSGVRPSVVIRITILLCSQTLTINSDRNIAPRPHIYQTLNPAAFTAPKKPKMSKVAVFTDKAPKPRPVYSQAIVANGFVFCSGQIPKDLSGKIVEGTVQDRTVSGFRDTEYPANAYSQSYSINASPIWRQFSKPQVQASMTLSK